VPLATQLSSFIRSPAHVDLAMKKLRSQLANDCGQPLANKADPRRAGN
jgi:hypothetical protein